MKPPGAVLQALACLAVLGCSDGDAGVDPGASSALPNCPAAEASPPRPAYPLPPPPTLETPYAADATLERYFEHDELGVPPLAPIDTDDRYEHAAELQYLSGRGLEDAVGWDFMVSGGRNAGAWSTLPVPSNWEFHGFGTYSYGRDADDAETGLYRKAFEVPAAWRGRRVFLVFEGAMTDAEVTLNGQSAGPVHRGAFYRFQYDVTSLLDVEHPNLLEVRVAKRSSDASVNAAERQADYWVFGGIFRPVYLAAYPEQFIERMAVDAQANGDLNVDVYLQGLVAGGSVHARVFDDRLQAVGGELSAEVARDTQRVRVTGNIPDVEPWSPERPRRYRLELALDTGGGVAHALRENIGFRTVEVRPGDGIYVNGVRRKLRGVNRHSFWPNSGRTTSETLSHYDVQLLKSMNANAVRSSHYPPDRHFLDACDREGLFVLDELAGWHASYDSGVGRQLAKEMVTFDVNHPSIILWDNGNEGGWNVALDREILRWDPQRRKLLHPWSTYSGINTQHYPTYARVASLLEGQTIYLSTEFSHAMYDQGGGASLDD
ncbi:MAG TPA: glycoside hydrolase family 2 TIM barrel-domain containing protein, partial [Polyangiaceae bacterium]|nr:glycoside hydrolase family 2 TIM barrel-domain containing protein [Polyangiaceae bacterium]